MGKKMNYNITQFINQNVTSFNIFISLFINYNAITNYKSYNIILFLLFL